MDGVAGDGCAVSDRAALIAEAQERTRAVLAAQNELARLASERREAVARLRMDGMSLAEIADALGLTRSGVQSLLRGPSTSGVARTP